MPKRLTATIACCRSLSELNPAHVPWPNTVSMPLDARQIAIASAGEISSHSIELSIVIPCLNEHETVGNCVRKARQALERLGVAGEVVVADNGSEDGSIALAEREGARVVHVDERGYGRALMAGIESARGRWIIMGDADDSYDFSDISKFIEKLREGFSVVQGCRFPSGGGMIRPRAMPLLHRAGNPFLSRLARLMFHSPVRDLYCGMRAFDRRTYDRLKLRCTGMEFAAEMIIKAALHNESIAEVPITLWPDGRQTRRPHLRTFRDGWRTLRFFLLYSPRWLFWYPGWLLILLGLLGYGLALPGFSIFGAQLDAHTLLIASLAMITGYQSCWFSVLSTTYAVTEDLRPMNRNIERFFEIFRLETGLAAGAVAVLTGGTLLLLAVGRWWSVAFGPLDYPQTMRLVIPGVTLVALGVQTVLSSFLCSMFGLKTRQ